MSSADSYVWPHLSSLPGFRALIRSIEHRLLDEQKPFAAPVLDVGVGDGHFAEAALGRGLDVGIDVDRATLPEARARRLYRHLLDASAMQMPFASNTFATVISNCVIEHIPDLGATLGEMARVLRPGGTLLLTVPTDQLERNLPGPALLRGLGLAGPAERYTHWFRRVQVHFHLLSRAGWTAALERVGLEVAQTRGYMSARATRYFEWGHYLGLPNLAARKLTGRWVPWDWRPLFGPAEALLDEFVAEPEHPDDSCLFLRARKP
ncbi:MAG: class I SAM-dependent methyltransferase [Anaerolineales bacterium]|nr:class I SAM-dependent methyltransferase [Anaerolineales bacterium]